MSVDGGDAIASPDNHETCAAGLLCSQVVGGRRITAGGDAQGVGVFGIGGRAVEVDRVAAEEVLVDLVSDLWWEICEPFGALALRSVDVLVWPLEARRARLLGYLRRRRLGAVLSGSILDGGALRDGVWGGGRHVAVTAVDVCVSTIVAYCTSR